MTAGLLDFDQSDDHPADTGSTERSRRTLGTVAIALMAVAGLVVLMYPSIASWFSARAQSSEISSYTEQLEAAAPDVKSRLLDAAHEYNAAIPEILLTDPYSVQDAMTGKGGAYETYHEQLALELGGDDPLEPMATIRIPTIGVTLAVRHGTDDDVLDVGAGHLFGSSLPVGGPGTHSVITAHNGLVEATMFDNLPQLVPGDVITVDVMGEQLTYAVTGTETVLPDQVSSLRLIPGRDLITLVTCTPTGVNSHRLLVQAERVPDPAVLPDQARTLISAPVAGPGFPWWTVQLAIGTAVVLAIVTAAHRYLGRRDGAVPEAGRHRAEAQPS